MHNFLKVFITFTLFLLNIYLQITEYENRIMQLKGDAEEESKRICKLEEDLAKEKHTVRSLMLQLQRDKNTAEEDKARDTELIRELRIKLDEASELRDKLIMELKSFEVMNAMKAQSKTEMPGKNNDDFNA